MTKIRLLMLLAGAWAMMTLSAPHTAGAGIVKVHNSTWEYHITVYYDTYIMGRKIPTFFSVEPGTTQYQDMIIDAIGSIVVKSHTVSSYGVNSSMKTLKTYTVPGVWLPHRKFFVDVDRNLKVTISEY